MLTYLFTCIISQKALDVLWVAWDLKRRKARINVNMKVFQTALPVVVCLQKHRSQNFPIVLLLMWQGGLMEHSAPAILNTKVRTAVSGWTSCCCGLWRHFAGAKKGNNSVWFNSLLSLSICLCIGKHLKVNSVKSQHLPLLSLILR